MKKQVFIILFAFFVILTFTYYPCEGNSLPLNSPEYYVSQKVGVSKGFERTLTWLYYYTIMKYQNQTQTIDNQDMLGTQLTYKVVKLPGSDGYGNVKIEGNYELTKSYITDENENELQISFYDYIDSYIIYTDWNGWKNYFNAINNYTTNQTDKNTGSYVYISISIKETIVIINYDMHVNISSNEKFYSTITYKGKNIYDKDTGSIVFRDSNTTFKDIYSGKIHNYNSRHVILKDLSYSGLKNDKTLPSLDFIVIIPSLIIISLLVKKTNISKKK